MPTESLAATGAITIIPLETSGTPPPILPASPERPSPGRGAAAREGDSAGGHDGVADELLDGAPPGRDDVRHRGEVLGEDGPHPFGVEPLAKRGRSHPVGEQDG